MKNLIIIDLMIFLITIIIPIMNIIRINSVSFIASKFAAKILLKNETEATIEKILWLLLLSSFSASALLSSLHLLFVIAMGVLFLGGYSTNKYSVAVRTREYTILKAEPPISIGGTALVYICVLATPRPRAVSCIFAENKIRIL